MTPEEAAERFSANVRAWADHVAEQRRARVTPADEAAQRRAILATVVEEAHRSGLPVVRAYFEDGAIVLEHAQPAGYG